MQQCRSSKQTHCDPTRPTIEKGDGFVGAGLAQGDHEGQRVNSLGYKTLGDWRYQWNQPCSDRKNLNVEGGVEIMLRKSGLRLKRKPENHA